MTDYLEKLKDPRWQKKRLEILERDHWTCRGCGEIEKTLSVHHIFYLPHTDPWDIPNGFLLTLCKDCHAPHPCEGYSSCGECSEYDPQGQEPGGCGGPGNIPKEITDIIAAILNEVWIRDGRGFQYALMPLRNLTKNG